MDVPAIITATTAAIGFLAISVYGWRYIATRAAHGELAAKDEIIRTSEQTVHALQTQLDVIKAELAVTADKVRRLEVQLAEALDKHKELQEYTAPAAVKAFHRRLDEEESTFDEMIEILRRLDSGKGATA